MGRIQDIFILNRAGRNFLRHSSRSCSNPLRFLGTRERTRSTHAALVSSAARVPRAGRDLVAQELREGVQGEHGGAHDVAARPAKDLQHPSRGSNHGTYSTFLAYLALPGLPPFHPSLLTLDAKDLQQPSMGIIYGTERPWNITDQ